MTFSRRSALPEGGIPESTILQSGRTQRSKKKSAAFAKFAYLLGHKSLLVPTTLRRTSEHDPIVKIRVNLFRTSNRHEEGP